MALAKGQDLRDAERRDSPRRWRPTSACRSTSSAGQPARRPGRFRKELLRDQRLILGRYDARFTGIDADAAGETPEYDPSDTGITGAFVAAFHDYLTRDLGYTTDLTYWPTYYSTGLTGTSTTRAPASAAPAGSMRTRPTWRSTCRQAMRENPHLLLYSLNGLYDMATPFFGTEYDLGHM